MAIESIPRAGVGLQLNHTIFTSTLSLKGIQMDFGEVLCDTFAGPVDSCYAIEPEARPVIDAMMEVLPLIAHGNYGAEFGFDPVESTRAHLRHNPVAHAMKSPWYADHMLFGDRASSYMWSSPLQFTKSEIERVAGRAAKLQDLFGMPVIHENAFYYAPFPGSTIAEADFISEIMMKAGTHMLLDLHNIYANSVNFEGYDAWKYLRTIPLDRVVEIHLAGGEPIEDWYHDFHNDYVPDEVWKMLDYVLDRAPNLKAVCLEAQGARHTPSAKQVTPEWGKMISHDLGKARTMWEAKLGEAAREGAH